VKGEEVEVFLQLFLIAFDFIVGTRADTPSKWLGRYKRKGRVGLVIKYIVTAGGCPRGGR